MEKQNMLSAEMIVNAMGFTMEEWKEKCRMLEDEARRAGRERYQYKTFSDEVADIRGNKKRDYFILWYEGDTAMFQIIVSRVWQNDSTRYFIMNDMEYISRDADGKPVYGINITGIDMLMIKIDNGQVVTLKDNSPAKREIPVVPYNAARTHETAIFSVSAALVEQLSGCNELRLQLRHDHRLIEIPKEGIEKLKAFLTMPRNKLGKEQFSDWLSLLPPLWH